MKRVLLAAGFVAFAAVSSAQSDSISPSTPDTAAARVSVPNDTIRMGNMIIIRSGNDRGDRNVYRKNNHANENLRTNWFVIDIGFNQINDQTNYTQAISSGYLPAGANEDWFSQRNFKSTNINIWVFMQRLNLIKHVIHLKYGAGLELNNYKYTENIRFSETGVPLVTMDTRDYKKNKLAADYITIPVMLNINLTPGKKHAFGFSAGMSAGYLYASRQKTVGGGLDKKKYRDDLGLRTFKVSYIGELAFGPIKLYGSYATRSMFEKGLDQTPFNFGIRISN